MIIERVTDGPAVQIIGIPGPGKSAPCEPDGEVSSLDDDTREALCVCGENPAGCPVDGRNKVMRQPYYIVIYTS